MHQRHGAVCLVANATHGTDGCVHGHVVVLVDLVGANPRVDHHHADVVLLDLGRHVVEHLVVDLDPVAPLVGEYHVEAPSGVEEQAPPYFLGGDAVMQHRRRKASLHLLQRVFKVDDPHLARLVYGLAQQRLARSDCERLHDLQRRLPDAARRGKHADMASHVMLPVDPPPRRYARGVYWLVCSWPLALACDALLLYFLDRLRQRQRLAQLLRAGFLQVVVGILYVFHAQRVEAHDVDVCAAVAAQHVCNRLHV